MEMSNCYITYADLVVSGDGSCTESWTVLLTIVDFRPFGTVLRMDVSRTFLRQFLL